MQRTFILAPKFNDKHFKNSNPTERKKYSKKKQFFVQHNLSNESRFHEFQRTRTILLSRIKISEWNKWIYFNYCQLNTSFLRDLKTNCWIIIIITHNYLCSLVLMFISLIKSFAYWVLVKKMVWANRTIFVKMRLPWSSLNLDIEINIHTRRGSNGKFRRMANVSAFAYFKAKFSLRMRNRFVRRLLPLDFP